MYDARYLLYFYATSDVRMYIYFYFYVLLYAIIRYCTVFSMILPTVKYIKW